MYFKEKMKTAASSTKKELGKFLVDLAISEIETWASTELKNLRNTLEFPICIQLSDKKWVIGSYTVKHLAQNSWQVTHDDNVVHVFYSKQASMFYPVFMALHYYKTADNLLKADQEAAKLNDEMQFYSAKLSKHTQDSFKQQLWEAKYINARAKYRYAKSDLEKTLKSAKYCKIWEKIL
jgi:hypothetical protein